MSQLNLTESRALGSIALGIVSATLAIGCGSGDGSGAGGEPTSPSEAAITARAITVNGCLARGVFDITSPTSIDFVAMNRAPNLRDVQMQLFTVDGQGHQTPVQTTAQQANPQLQSQLDGTTDSIRVLTTSQVAGVASGATNPSIVGSTVGANTQTTSNGGGQSAWQSANHGDSRTADTSRYATNEGDRSDQSISHQYSGNGNAAGTAAASAATSVAVGDLGDAVRTAAILWGSSALAFSNLSQLASNHMMLVVNLTASGTSGVLRLFQGSNGVVTVAQDFSFVTPPACGAGA
jgi:hypothetical protein